MIKYQKRLVLYALCIVFLFFSFSVVSAETMKECHTQHFSFLVPADWLRHYYGHYMSFTKNPDGKMDGGYLFIAESSVNLMDDPVSDFYDWYIDGFVENIENAELETESILINGRESVLFSYNFPADDSCFRMFNVAYYDTGYNATLSFADPLMDDNTSKEYALQLANTLKFSKESLFTNDEKVEYAASLVYGDKLISSRAGKYPTIDVQEYGTVESIRSATNQHVFDFLKEIRAFREDDSLSFEDVRINVYTALMDVYGNEFEDCVLGFNISAESIDKINFEKMPIDNIPKIAFNWYEHPAITGK